MTHDEFNDSRAEIAKMKQHTRASDELLLIQFVEDQGFDIVELVEAAKRLKECIYEKLIDYSKPRTENDSDKNGE